jgi:hypothetical protein
MPPPPSSDFGSKIDKRTNEKYVSELPVTIGQIRDAAITNNLSKKEINIVAKKAAMREFALNRIVAEVYTPDRYNVVVDALREPVYEMNAQTINDVHRRKKADLIALNLVVPMENLAPAQRKIAYALGIRGKSFTSVHYDKPDLHKAVKDLEGVVNVSEFSAVLPD